MKNITDNIRQFLHLDFCFPPGPWMEISESLPKYNDYYSTGIYMPDLEGERYIHIRIKDSFLDVIAMNKYSITRQICRI